MDPSDDIYLKDVESGGISTSGRTDALIQAGHAVCQALSEGSSPKEVVVGLTLGNDDVDLHEAEYVVGAAIAAYCPQYKSDDDS